MQVEPSPDFCREGCPGISQFTEDLSGETQSSSSLGNMPPAKTRVSLCVVGPRELLLAAVIEGLLGNLTLQPGSGDTHQRPLCHVTSFPESLREGVHVRLFVCGSRTVTDRTSPYRQTVFP